MGFSIFLEIVELDSPSIPPFIGFITFKKHENNSSNTTIDNFGQNKTPLSSQDRVICNFVFGSIPLVFPFAFTFPPPPLHSKYFCDREREFLVNRIE